MTNCYLDLLISNDRLLTLYRFIMSDEVTFTIHCGSQTQTNVGVTKLFYDDTTGTLAPTFNDSVADTICESIHLFYPNDPSAQCQAENQVRSGVFGIFFLRRDTETILSSRMAPRYIQACIDKNEEPSFIVRLESMSQPSPSPTAARFRTTGTSTSPAPTMSGGGAPTSGSSPTATHTVAVTINSKQFSKKDSVTLKSRDRALIWYRSLVAHGAMYGIWIPPSNSLRKGKVMGTLWDPSLVDSAKFAEEYEMSNHLAKFLATEDLFPKTCDDLRNIVDASTGNGYVALHNIMRALHHPNLSEKVVEQKIPFQKTSMDFGRYVQNVDAYVEREHLRGRLFTRWEGTSLALSNLHPTYREKMKEKAERTFAATHDRLNNIPFELRFEQLATTLAIWCAELGIELPKTKEPSVRSVNAIEQQFCEDCGGSHESGTCLSELEGTVNAIDLKGGDGQACGGCGLRGHTIMDCDDVINAVLGVDLATRLSKSQRASILSRHMHFRRRPLRTRDRRFNPGSRFNGRGAHRPEQPRSTKRDDVAAIDVSVPTDTDPAPSTLDHENQDAEVCEIGLEDVCRISADTYDEESSLHDDFVLTAVDFDLEHAEGNGTVLGLDEVNAIAANWEEEMIPSERRGVRFHDAVEFEEDDKHSLN